MTSYRLCNCVWKEEGKKGNVGGSVALNDVEEEQKWVKENDWS